MARGPLRRPACPSLPVDKSHAVFPNSDMLSGMSTPHVSTVTTLLAAHGGVVTTVQLRRSGLTTAQIAGLVSSGVLERLRRDVLVDAKTWASTPLWERHAPRARGVIASLDPDGSKGLALSHHSALALHGVALHGVDDVVHLVRVGKGRGYRSRGVQVHAPVAKEHVTDAFGLRVVRPAPAVMQVAAGFGVPSGLVAADSALRAGLCSRGDLEALVGWPALRTTRSVLRIVAERAEGLHESAGESRCAWLMHVLGLPPARPQVTLVTGDGRFVARVDFCIPEHRVVVEFDGMGKYTDREVVRREKIREDRIRALGVQVVRLTWADLDHPEVVRQKIEAAIARNRVVTA